MENKEHSAYEKRSLLPTDAQLEQRPATKLALVLLDDDRGSRRLSAGRSVTDIVLSNPGAAQSLIHQSYEKPYLSQALKNSERQPMQLEDIRKTFQRTVQFFNAERISSVLDKHPLTKIRVRDLKDVLKEIDPELEVSDTEVVLRLLSEDSILHGRDEMEWVGILDSLDVYAAMQDQLIDENEQIDDIEEDRNLIALGQNLLISTRILTELGEDVDTTKDLNLHPTAEQDFQSRMAQLNTIAALAGRLTSGPKNETTEGILESWKLECQAIYDHILRYHPVRARLLGNIVGAIEASAWTHDDSINYPGMVQNRTYDK